LRAAAARKCRSGALLADKAYDADALIGSLISGQSLQ